MKIRTFAFLLVVTALLSVAFVANAQTEAVAAEGFCPSHDESSVSVTLQPFPSKVATGAFLPVVARVTNLEPYPLSGGSLLMRLVSLEPADSDFSGLSGAVLARSVALDDIFVAAGESKELSFIFSLPSTLPKGKYLVEAVYSVSGLSPDGVDALPSVNKPNSGFAAISIEGMASGGFAFVDPRTISVAESDEGEVSVSVDVVNMAKAEASVPLLWKAYRGNATIEDSAVTGSVETIRVPASGRTKASYRLDDGSYSSYSILAAAAFGGVSSYAAARAEDVRGGALVRQLGIATSTEGWKAFGCVTNAFVDDEVQRLVSLSVTDGSGMGLGRKEFSVAGELNDLEFSLPFTIAGTGDVIVAAEIISGGGSKESFQKVFRCSDLGTCAAVGTGRASAAGELLFAATMLIAGLGGIIAVLLRPKKLKQAQIYTS
ncbi:MAG: hypothetical protein HZA81_01590 [Candidatus Taylorbacteria bacterium]|nr:hypothetical protein [Candidatus Taylorbacteria bacterium]